MGPKRGPNRIFDAEALGKPLGTLLERSWALLERKKVIWNRSWAVLRRPGNRKHRNINLAIMEREAGQQRESQDLQSRREAPSWDSFETLLGWS